LTRVADRQCYTGTCTDGYQDGDLVQSRQTRRHRVPVQASPKIGMSQAFVHWEEKFERPVEHGCEPLA
jgi:hypothetical protein